MSSPPFAICRAAGLPACRAPGRPASAYSIRRLRRPPRRDGCAPDARPGGCARPRSGFEPATRSPHERQRNAGRSCRTIGIPDFASLIRATTMTSIRPADAELDRLFQRLLHRGGREQSERVGRDRAVVPRPLDRVLERAVLGRQADRVLEIGVGRVTLFQGPPPERPFALRAAAEREHDRERDLALAEIVAHVLAELGGLAAVVERVVDELEGDAEIHPERAAGGLLVLRPRRQRRADLAGGREQLGGLGADNREILVLGGGGVLGRAEL